MSHTYEVALVRANGTEYLERVEWIGFFRPELAAIIPVSNPVFTVDPDEAHTEWRFYIDGKVHSRQLFLKPKTGQETIEIRNAIVYLFCDTVNHPAQEQD